LALEKGECQDSAARAGARPRLQQGQSDLVGQEHAALGEGDVTVAASEEAGSEVRRGECEVDVFDGQASGGAQLERDAFQTLLVRRQSLPSTGRGQSPADGIHVVLGRAEVPPSARIAERMRAGTEPEVRPPL